MKAKPRKVHKEVCNWCGIMFVPKRKSTSAIQYCCTTHAIIDSHNRRKAKSGRIVINENYQEIKIHPYLFVGLATEDPTLHRIEKVVFDYFKVTREQVESKSRKREFVMPRQILMYIQHKLLVTTLQAIGNRYGGRNHATILHSIDTVQDQIDVNKNYARMINGLVGVCK